MAALVHGLPSDWPLVLAHVARTYSFTLAEIEALSVEELMFWHEAAEALRKVRPHG